MRRLSDEDAVFYALITAGLAFLLYLAVTSGALCPAFLCLPIEWGSP